MQPVSVVPLIHRLVRVCVHPIGRGICAAIISLGLQSFGSCIAQAHHVRGMVMICSHEATLQIKRVAGGGIGEKAHALKAQRGMCNERLYQRSSNVMPS